MTKNQTLIGFASMLLALLAACSSQPAEPVSFNITMSEYAYTPATLEVNVGQEVTIDLENSGVLSHELMFGREVVHSDGHPNGFKVDMFTSAGVEPEIISAPTGDMSKDEHMHDSPGVMVTLPKTGDMATIRFIVTDDMLGEWEMGCFEQDGLHYTAGMVGTLVVKP